MNAILNFFFLFCRSAALERHKKFIKYGRPKGQEFMAAVSYGSSCTNDEV